MHVYSSVSQCTTVKISLPRKSLHYCHTRRGISSSAVPLAEVVLSRPFRFTSFSFSVSKAMDLTLLPKICFVLSSNAHVSKTYWLATPRMMMLR